MLVDVFGDVVVDIIWLLCFMSMMIFVDEYGGLELFVVFEYVFDDSLMDDVLFVNFGFDGSV